MEALSKKAKEILQSNWLLIGIIFLGLVLRLGYTVWLGAPITWGDSLYYDASAWNFAKGYGYSIDGIRPFVGREPGYALFFLAPIYYIFGHNIWAIQVLQAILSVGTIILIYLIAKEYLGEKAALLAAFIYSIWPADIIFSQEILTEIPFAFLLLLSIWFLLKGIKKDSSKKIFISGLILGLATLVRFISVLLPFFYLIYFYLIFKKNYKKALKYFLLIFAGVIIFVTPWFVRNYYEFHTFVFGRGGSWQMYWSGSYIPWNGEWLGYKTPLTNIMKGDNLLENDKILKNETIKNIKSNPLGVAGVWIKKPLKVFLKSVSYGQITNSVRLNHLAGFWEVVLRRGFQLTQLLIVFLAMLGSVFLYRKEENDTGRKWLLPLFLIVLFYHIVFLLPMNPDSRYQVPLMSYFIIMGSFAVVEIYALMKRKGLIKMSLV